jgi:hypothetical protein
MVRLEECSLENELVEASLNILGSQMQSSKSIKEMEIQAQRAATKEHDACEMSQIG